MLPLTRNLGALAYIQLKALEKVFPFRLEHAAYMLGYNIGLHSGSNCEGRAPDHRTQLLPWQNQNRMWLQELLCARDTNCIVSGCIGTLSGTPPIFVDIAYLPC